MAKYRKKPVVIEATQLTREIIEASVFDDFGFMETSGFLDMCIWTEGRFRRERGTARKQKSGQNEKYLHLIPPIKLSHHAATIRVCVWRS